MGIKQSLEKRLIKFGSNNSATVVAMSIAAAKGIFRPAFTMADKKENYETKRYTAIREGLTEIIAIPVYYASGEISKFISKKIAVPKNFMPKNIYKKYKAGVTSPEIQNAVKHAEELASINLNKIKSTSAFAGVCISAIFAIPFICSATIKPIMQKLETKNKNSVTKNLSDIKSKEVSFKQNNMYKPYISYNSGMKVGRV